MDVKHIASFDKLSDDQPIDDISHYIPDAYTRLQLTQQKLMISVPQIAMSKKRQVRLILAYGMMVFLHWY